MTRVSRAHQALDDVESIRKYVARDSVVIVTVHHGARLLRFS